MDIPRILSSMPVFSRLGAEARAKLRMTCSQIRDHGRILPPSKDEAQKIIRRAWYRARLFASACSSFPHAAPQECLDRVANAQRRISYREIYHYICPGNTIFVPHYGHEVLHCVIMEPLEVNEDGRYVGRIALYAGNLCLLKVDVDVPRGSFMIDFKSFPNVLMREQFLTLGGGHFRIIFSSSSSTFQNLRGTTFFTKCVTLFYLPNDKSNEQSIVASAPSPLAFFDGRIGLPLLGQE